MIRFLLIDTLKMKKKWVWFLVFLGPAGVVGLEAFNFLLRYDWLTKQYQDDLWGGLIDESRILAVPALMMGLAIVASILAGIEHQTNSWKQMLALPVSKCSLFTAKFMLLTFLLFISCTCLGLGLIGLGAALGFGTKIPLVYLLKISYYPFLAALPFAALHTWLSIVVKNQAIALTCGIIGTILSLYGVIMPDWVPYKWLFLENSWGKVEYSAAAGVLTGLLVYLVGLLDFYRRDVL
ncbi:ABC transporter permease [Peribacillus sp. FSL H8-0477]|uniref:ABC transporter permease n=1 Tax=Peribacillus sp. FSL H8-0477 TaxID=2921388 RepID=UPI0030F97D95